MANVYDVGQYITELVPTVNTMKLYKLCYFSQGWKLAWTGCLLFQEPLKEFTDLLHSTPNVPSCPPGALIPENYSLETALAAIAEIEKTWGGTLALLAMR